MFAPYCERHGSRILLPTTAIKALETTAEGLVAYFECSCGHFGVWRPGRPAS